MGGTNQLGLLLLFLAAGALALRELGAWHWLTWHRITWGLRFHWWKERWIGRPPVHRGNDFEFLRANLDYAERSNARLALLAAAGLVAGVVGCLVVAWWLR